MWSEEWEEGEGGFWQADVTQCALRKISRRVLARKCDAVGRERDFKDTFGGRM